MQKNRINKTIGAVCLALSVAACNIPARLVRSERSNLPASFTSPADTATAAIIKWPDYFTDANLIALIDSALRNNQELNILQREIEIAKNEIRIKKGEYLPSVGLRGGAGFEKAARYTLPGATESAVEIVPGSETPEPLGDLGLNAYAQWEVDIWHKLRNAKKAAVNRYLASAEGRNFQITRLVAEVAEAYYELLALDTQLDIVNQNIGIQTNALEIVKLQKVAARVTELAVQKFEAEVAKTTALQFDIRQQITETENRINFLLGRFPQPVKRSAGTFTDPLPPTVSLGIPSQLLENRPDIRRAEQELAAAKLDVQVARAQFYPQLAISATVGYQAFNPKYLFRTPESILYSLAGDMVAPLINKNAIKATYLNANARQEQAVFNYERTILNAYTEVVNQLAKISNMEQSYRLKSRQVQALTQSIEISNDLFKSARADYMEVLMTQRDALESKFELIETRLHQMNARVNIYQALGGGWLQ